LGTYQGVHKSGEPGQAVSGNVGLNILQQSQRISYLGIKKSNYVAGMTNILKGQYRLMTNQAKLGSRLDLNDKNYLTVSPPNIVFYFKSTLNLFLRQKLQIQGGPGRGAALGPGGYKEMSSIFADQ
jgi:hypothetical protein